MGQVKTTDRIRGVSRLSKSSKTSYLLSLPRTSSLLEGQTMRKCMSESTLIQPKNGQRKLTSSTTPLKWRSCLTLGCCAPLPLLLWTLRWLRWRLSLWKDRQFRRFQVIISSTWRSWFKEHCILCSMRLKLKLKTGTKRETTCTNSTTYLATQKSSCQKDSHSLTKFHRIMKRASLAWLLEPSLSTARLSLSSI